MKKTTKTDEKAPKKNMAARRMLRIALLLTGIYLLGHLFGLRELTSILSGTLPGTAGQAMLGLVYVMSWFGFVLVAPILTIAGGLQLAWGRLRIALHKRVEESEPRPSLVEKRLVRATESPLFTK